MATPPTTVKKTAKTKVVPEARRLAAEADKAAARAELAKQQVRAAKADLKKARKSSKAAKKAAKQARKKALAAQTVMVAAARPATGRRERPAVRVKRSVGTKSAGRNGPPADTLHLARMPSAAEAARSVIKRLRSRKSAGSTSPQNHPAASVEVADVDVHGGPEEPAGTS